MPPSWRADTLPELAARLARRPGHETVRTHLTEILRHGLGVRAADLKQEDYRARVRGRIDTLFESTVFEWKTDLRRELDDVRRRLPDYLADVARETGRPPLGIATDGATFIAFETRGGALVELRHFTLDPEKPEALLRWLEPAVSRRDDILPTPQAIRDALGRDSLTWAHASRALAALWAALAAHPEAQLKRKLWDDLLAEVYGSRVGDDALFLQHTYLTIIAKTIALHVLEQDADDAAGLLSGRTLEQAGIVGAVESDFFDWVLHAPGGADLVLRLARQTERFRLRDVQQDVLKSLYESLIDPAERHDLGEYYTPDWLAAKLTRAAVTDPLTQVVLDPACGSGTFLFHAVRRLLAAAAAAGWPTARAVAAAAAQVRGIDVHPVAAIIARVTWLLALGPAELDRAGTLAVPVYLGDSLQWNLREAVGARDVVVRVPDESPITIPGGFAENEAIYDAGLSQAMSALRAGSDDRAFVAALRRLPGVTEADARAMAEPFRRLKALYAQGRDDIWPFVLRNLVRPLWLSRPDNRADVVIGNPPWLAYRFMAPEMQARVREACRAAEIWAGGRFATQQDLSALFWVRSAERYLKQGGTIAFLLPYAAMNRPAYRGLREGMHRRVQIRITEAWTFDEHVQPLFPVPACALFGRRGDAGPLPGSVRRYAGDLPRRDAPEAEADAALTVRGEPWPAVPTMQAGSPYRARFRQGATIVPRRFFIVEPARVGRLGANPAAPRVRGRVSGLDKPPWRTVQPPEGPVEKRFLRPVVLGETILPFRLLPPAVGVIPTDDRGEVMDARTAARAGFPHLAAWLRDAETKWNANAAKKADGSPKVDLKAQLDHLHKLSVQVPTPPLRVAYAKAGTLLAACLIDDPLPVIDHMAYWASARTRNEAHYLLAILNSEATRARVAAMQARGQWGARHFDKLVWELPIPEYDPRNSLHRDLARAGARAETLAAAVPLRDNAGFRAHRAAIRTALAESGLAAEIDTLAARLVAR
jgi:SAM-dependent methyltransferase